jgi:hypothetical protein
MRLSSGALIQAKVNFADVDICERCLDICLAFPSLTVAKVLQKCTDTTFREQYDGAGAKRDDLQPLKWPRQGSVQDVVQRGCRLEVWYWFLSLKEFVQRFKLDPKALAAVGLRMSELHIKEEGKTARGVVVKPTQRDGCDMYPRVGCPS